MPPSGSTPTRGDEPVRILAPWQQMPGRAAETLPMEFWKSLLGLLAIRRE